MSRIREAVRAVRAWWGEPIPYSWPDLTPTVPLLACPFCGSPGELESFGGGRGHYPWIMATCTECGASSDIAKTVDEATEAWNRRTPPPNASVERAGTGREP